MRQLQEPQVTIVVVLRERFTLTERSLSSIYKNTQCPFRLVYVVGKAPLRTLRYLKNEAEEKGFLLITTEHHISPNQARNLGLKEVKTKYVVFIDNDANVAALGEATYGAGKDYNNVLYITVGSGVGGRAVVRRGNE